MRFILYKAKPWGWLEHLVETSASFTEQSSCPKRIFVYSCRATESGVSSVIPWVYRGGSRGSFEPPFSHTNYYHTTHIWLLTASIKNNDASNSNKGTPLNNDVMLTTSMRIYASAHIHAASTKVGVVQNFRRAQSAQFCLQKSPPLTNPVSAPGIQASTHAGQNCDTICLSAHGCLVIPGTLW